MGKEKGFNISPPLAPTCFRSKQAMSDSVHLWGRSIGALTLLMKPHSYLNTTITATSTSNSALRQPSIIAPKIRHSDKGGGQRYKWVSRRAGTQMQRDARIREL